MCIYLVMFLNNLVLNMIDVSNYVPKQIKVNENDFGMFTLNINEMCKQMMPNIHRNKNIPKEIKDAWIELCLITNIDKLYESMY